MENNKLQSMTDFVIEQKERKDIDLAKRFINSYNYANFLKQHLELWHFVPCKLIDGVWTVLEEPKSRWKSNDERWGTSVETYGWKLYQQAKERVLFEGFEYIGNNYVRILCVVEKGTEFLQLDDEMMDFLKIEDLVKYNLTLTQTAIKQIYENN